MRKFLPFLFAAALASSCIDNAYDLSNVNTDDVTIGDEDWNTGCRWPRYT